MSSVRAVDDFAARYHARHTEAEGTLKVYDYLRSPKADGYRGIHVVGRFAARAEARQPWNGQRIEVQLRSRLQHAFATAVETVTTFTRSPLKFGGGPEEWRRFFSLMGSALAMREGTPLVEGTPSDPEELVEELRYRSEVLDVNGRLRGWANALKAIPRRHVTGAKWLLMVLDVNKNTVRVTGYNNRQKAATALAKIERYFDALGSFDAVLVWVPSAHHLRAAYPNYYADTGEFLNALNQALQLSA